MYPECNSPCSQHTFSAKRAATDLGYTPRRGSASEMRRIAPRIAELRRESQSAVGARSVAAAVGVAAVALAVVMMISAPDIALVR